MAGGGKAPLAVSMGEPAGIGPDLILSLYAQRDALGLPPFIVYGNLDFLRARAARLKLDVLLAALEAHGGRPDFDDALSVVEAGGPVADKPGKIDKATAPVVIEAISQAVHDTHAGHCRGVVTAPIHKAALYGSGFGFPGHTEFLAELCARDGSAPRPVMMLAGGDLRVVPATIHVPLREVPDLLSVNLLVETGWIVATDLRERLGITSPKLALTGLNPHAGEDGALGREDAEIIAPACEMLRNKGIEVTGPLPADSVFHLPRWREFDAVIAMYHDQALIPIKTVAFDSAVNVTLGLPFVRTSPDHGTALDLAGTGLASQTSFLAALRLADEMSA